MNRKQEKVSNEEQFEETLVERASTPPKSFSEYLKRSDPNYWGEAEWFAARIIPLSIKPIETATRLAIVAEGVEIDVRD